MSKKKLDKEFEKFEAVAEGSVEDAKKVFLEEEKESKEKRNEVLNFLTSKRSILEYNPIVASLLVKRLLLVDWQGWTFKVSPTKVGVVMEIYSPDKRIYRQAFKTVRGPHDLTAIDIFAIRAQNTIDGQERADSKNSRG